MDPSSQEWTFGQMIAILVLAAPVLTMIETYYDSKLLHIAPKTNAAYNWV